MRQRNSVIKHGDWASFVATRGKRVYVSIEDLTLVLKAAWHVQPNHASGKLVWYVTTSYRQKLHRVLLGAKIGQLVDHRDGNGLNNRRDNIRICNVSQNHGSRRATTSHLLKGVLKERRASTWRATICGRHLGNFRTAIEAAKAYDKAALAHYGPFARTNFHQLEMEVRHNDGSTT